MLEPQRRPRRGQRGASLLIVLGLITFLGLLLPAMLGLAATGYFVTRPILEDRNELYAATSAIEAAIEQGRTNPDVGVPSSGVCPEWTLEIGRSQIDIECFGPPDLEEPDDCIDEKFRYVNYRALDSTGTVLAGAEVVYPSDPFLNTAPYVVTWTTGVAAQGTGPQPTCTGDEGGGGGGGEVLLEPGVRSVDGVAVESPLDPDAPETLDGWRADAAVVVADSEGRALASVEVTVKFEYLPPPEPQDPADPAEPVAPQWIPDPVEVTVSTNEAGRANFFSAIYALPGGSVADVPAATDVRMTIVSVAEGQIEEGFGLIEIPAPVPAPEPVS